MLRLLPILAVLWLLLTGAASGKALHTADPPLGNFLINLSEASSPDALKTREGARKSDPFGYERTPGDAYCHNDPVNKVDVLGLKEQVIDGSAPAFFTVPGHPDHVYVGFPLEEDGWFSPFEPNGGHSIVPTMIPKSRFLEPGGYYTTTAAIDRLRGISRSQLELDYWLDAGFYLENGSQFVGGLGEMAAGVVVAPQSAGVSLVATVHGFDVANTAWTRLGAGRGSDIQSGTSQLIQFVPGVSRQTAENIDTGLSFVSVGGSMWKVGQGPLLLTPKFAPVSSGQPGETVFRFATRVDDATLQSNLSQASRFTQARVNVQMKIPAYRNWRAMRHMNGDTHNSPFVSVLGDASAGAVSPDPWLRTIITGRPGVSGVARAPDLGTFKVPRNRLYDPPPGTFQSLETERLFLGDDLRAFLDAWEVNPF